MFTLKIKTSGAAFLDPDGEKSNYDLNLELSRIFRELSIRLELDAAGDRTTTFGSLMDINGNKVGEFHLK